MFLVLIFILPAITWCSNFPQPVYGALLEFHGGSVRNTGVRVAYWTSHKEHKGISYLSGDRNFCQENNILTVYFGYFPSRGTISALRRLTYTCMKNFELINLEDVCHHLPNDKFDDFANQILDVIMKNSESPFAQLLHLSHKHNILRLPVNVSDKDVIKEGCDVFEGGWVWDNTSYPLYTEESCSFLVKQVTCQRNGRPDSFYKNWRWQPNACNLPRFNALKLLEVLRDKRLMFVGDSLQRGMFESMVCLVQSVIPEGKKSLTRIPPRKIFTAKDYNATIEYFWAPFLIESNSDNALNHTVRKRLVKLDSIAKHGKQWEGVDILVFESYIWWMYKPFINATFGSPYNIQEYKVSTAYKLALETWANWVETNINTQNQKMFFMSMSPTHLWSWEWKPGSDQNCYNEMHPIQGPYWGTGSNLEIMKIVRDVLGQLNTDVTLLNITQLSDYRKDGHTSVFGERRGKLLTKEQRSDPKNFADCIHWCLPGVPDTWNEILYAEIMKDYRLKIKKISPSPL